VRRLLAALASAALLAAASAAEEPAGPRIRVDPESFDFGGTLPGKTLRREFVIRNFGDAELVIEGISTTCGCTAALPAEDRVKPGGSTPLRVTFETRRYTGRVVREVLVRSNDPQTPLLRIRVTATVAPPGAKRR
jgi:hypothetical protein